MGWFGGSTPAKVSAVSQVSENESEPKFLEDLPPKFQDIDEPEQPSTIEALRKEFKFSDLLIDRYVKMPCFREAMITGFQAMGVLGGVTFLIRKNFQKSLNWGVTGFFLGNIIGFEQCRSIRRRSFQTVEKAKQANQNSNSKKWQQHQQQSDEQLTKFEEFNSRK